MTLNPSKAKMDDDNDDSQNNEPIITLTEERIERNQILDYR